MRIRVGYGEPSMAALHAIHCKVLNRGEPFTIYPPPSPMCLPNTGKENIESRSSQTMNARDEIGNEIWEVVESVSKPAK
jgi:hypothetical protein